MARVEGFKDLQRILREAEESLPDLRTLHTNQIAGELGVPNSAVNEYVAKYGKDVVKAASRVAAQVDARHKDRVPLAYLIQLVSLFGEGIALHLALIPKKFGWGEDSVIEALNFYGERIVRAAARIAEQYKIISASRDIKDEIPHLLEAIHWLGEDYTAVLVVRGVKPSDVINGNAVQQLISYTTPQVYVRKPLEVITGNAQINAGPRLAVGVPYQTSHYL